MSEPHKLLKAVDDQQNSLGDFHSLIYMEQKEKDKITLLYEAHVYRRNEDRRFMLLFTQPKSEQGKGYLYSDKNLWRYDPKVAAD
jgi:hypothetical protein